jgi:sarcosine oxidase subunit alpha
MSGQPHRLAAELPHGLSGGALDRSKPLRFKLNGQTIEGDLGDTVLSAALASGIDTAGTDGDQPLALDERFCPPIALARNRDALLPMERTPATDGADFVTAGLMRTRGPLRRLLKREGNSLGLDFSGGPLGQPWTHMAPSQVMAADVAIIGGGVAGLSAAEAIAKTGRKVIVIERRPWLGGDARYFGPVGNEETPEALIARLLEALTALPNVTLMISADAFDIAGGAVIAHQLQMRDGQPVSRVAAIGARHIILATGCVQRLPIFAGNRLPGVVGTAAAYHRAERYGVWRGKNTIVLTQGNIAYRLALRVHDAGIAVARIADTRLGAQSRFIDFAKATGFTLNSGVVPLAATARAEGGLALRIGGGAEQDIAIASGQIVVAGAWQPDVSLWMRAGGAIHWDRDSGLLVPEGHLDRVLFAGSVTGIETMKGAVLSGLAAAAQILGTAPVKVEDPKIDAVFETPDAATPIAPASAGRDYLDWGTSLVTRPTARPEGDSRVQRPLADDARPLSLGDVAAAVEAGLIEPDDAGIIAEERGMSGGAITQTSWAPTPGVSDDGVPAYLIGRFGPEPLRAFVTVDNRRQFETGALIYPNTAKENPLEAIGVIIGPAPEGKAGGTALFARARLKTVDRFIIRTARGAAPLRIAKRLETPVKPAG